MLLVVSYSRKWNSIAITTAIAIALLVHRGIGIAIAIFLICIANNPAIVECISLFRQKLQLAEGCE